MAAHGARRLLDMADNTSVVIGIELLAACQGIDFHAPLKSSDALGAAHKHPRAAVPMLEADRHFHPDMEAAPAPIRTGSPDRKSGGAGTSLSGRVDLGGRRIQK